MGVLGKIFGSATALNISKGAIDNAIYTPQEKAARFERLLALYEPFKIAQRLLALTFSIPYALAWIVTFITSFFKPVPLQLELLEGDVSKIVLVICAFYFSGGVIDSFKKTKE